LAVAHSPALETPPGAPSPLLGTALVRWTPAGITPVAPSDPDAPKIAHAVEVAKAKWTKEAAIASTDGKPAEATVVPLGSSDLSAVAEPLA
jgi:hypothetical protein